MKPHFLLGIFLCATALASHAAETAYAALRVFGKKDGEQSLNHVVEVRGKSGTPQPGSWKLTIDDPHARGGVRELEIRGGKIVAERAPTGHDFAAPMNFNQLNLDSDGAFTVANQEAEKHGVPFDRIDYTLKSEGAGAPLWTIELFEARNGRVALLRIAADSGAVVEQNFGPDRRFAGDRAYLDEGHARATENRSAKDMGNDVGDFFKHVGRHFQKRARQLNNFFTGQ